MATDAKMAAARSFVRSLNILLKFVRLYGFDHARSAEQFDNAWNELRASMPPGNEAGVLLGAAGSQLLLDGVPIEGAHAERSFAQLLSAAGLASIQFFPKITKDELERFVRAFPVGNAKPSALADQLRTALAGSGSIRVNEVRFVAEDASTAGMHNAASLMAKALGADSDQFKQWMNDPQKLLKLIAAAEGSRGGSGSGSSGSGTGSGGTGGGTGWRGGTGSGTGSGTGGGGTGSGGPGFGGGGGHPGGGGVKRIGGFAAGSESSDDDPGSGDTAASGYAGGTEGETYYSSDSVELVLSHDVHAIGIPMVATGGGDEFAGPGGFASGGGPQGGAPGMGGGSGSGAGFGTCDEEILGVLRLLTQLGQSANGGANLEPGPFQQEISRFSGRSRELLQQALASVAKQTPALQSDDPMLLRLADHLAIRFALDRYERGEVQVNAVREMLDRMSQEISTLRQVLGTHEEKMAEAGLQVESHADVLDRQFWASVPEAGKRAVLTSPDAWCIPPRNVRQYVEELREKGDLATAGAILEIYGTAVGSENQTARRRAAMGLAELADLYASGDARALTPTIRRVGVSIGVERENDIQGLLSAAFVRLAQEAGGQKHYPAVLQSLDALDSIENQRPAFAQTIRPRLGLEKRLPDFIDEAIRSDPRPEGLIEVIDRLPRPSGELLMTRFNRSGSRQECEGIAQLAQGLSSEAIACLRETMQSAPPTEAAETVGLLTRLDAAVVEKWLGSRLRDWPRMPQDRALRLIAGSGAPERGWVLLSLFDQFDAVLQPLAVDEIGMAGESSAAPRLLRMAGGDLPHGTGTFLRLKAIEALGRLREGRAADLLRDVLEAKKLWRWLYPNEFRIAAFHALRTIAPAEADSFLPHSGLDADDLVLVPLDPIPGTNRIRERRYPRVRLSAPVSAVASNERESIALELRGLSLSGGLATGERHIAPGTLVSLRLGSGLRPIRAQVFMRDARAQGLGFEIAEMDLDERGRLRRLLCNQGSASISADQAVEEHAETTSFAGSR